MAGRTLRLLVRTASGLATSWLGGARAKADKPRRAAQAVPAGPRSKARERVERVENFGPNPGQLRMFVYAPGQLPPAKGAMIVLLHGCGQEAASFAADSGWIGVARQLGILLVLPEQSRNNNRAGCFNWFEPADVRRGGGEVASIRQMIRVAAKQFATDPRKVFIVGLSAGGAMAAAMLAAYPATFAAGAVVAGMPVGSAHSVGVAILRMHHANNYTSRARLADAVRSASPARRKQTWPRISIWQGGQDRVIDPVNANVLVAQFSELHGFDAAPDTASIMPAPPGTSRQVWGDADHPAVELWRLEAMEHGFPIAASLPGGGRPGPAILDTGLSAANQITRFFGLDSSK